MTLNGAIKQLHDLRCADDMPVYYKPVIAEFINVLLMDAKEVRRGLWEKKHDDVCYWYECSVCAERLPRDQYGFAWHSFYCPCCGSMMSEEDKNEK